VSQDDLYKDAAENFGAALDRLSRAYEADPEKRRDLLQEIHFALWRSFEGYQARCSLRTWVYRVAHNTAASHVVRQRRANARNLVSLEELERSGRSADSERASQDRLALEKILQLVQRLKPLDREVMFLHLEGVDTAAIAEITGIPAGNVRVQIHRIKNILARRFHEGGQV
jgi:RNA polymerase sigma-70 factor (ECF subfamily)